MEKIGQDLVVMPRVALADSHVAAIRAAGVEMRYPAGTVLVRPRDPVDNFVYVVEGEIEIVNAFTGERLIAPTLGPTQFMGRYLSLQAAAGRWLIGLCATPPSFMCLARRCSR